MNNTTCQATGSGTPSCNMIIKGTSEIVDNSTVRYFLLSVYSTEIWSVQILSNDSSCEEAGSSETRTASSMTYVCTTMVIEYSYFHVNKLINNLFEFMC